MTTYRFPEDSGARRNHWVFATSPDPGALRDLSGSLKIPDAIAAILLQRGITSYDHARMFFRPSLDQTHDPYLMTDMEKAVRRLLKSVNDGQRICVYGDYDVDGTNGTAMLYRFLTDMGADVEYFIPDRLAEGYGLSVRGIDRISAKGYNLLVAVDCGITAVDAVDHATSLGIDVIICDHHEVGDTLPAAAAVLDPLKPGDPYPFKGLCGCGVAFKFIQAVLQQTGKTELVSGYLDNLALATIADIVPLTGENRILVKTGLQFLNENPSPGIRALIETAGLTPGRISAGHVVFALAPRINAVGRLGDAMRAVRLLICHDPLEGADLARILEDENRERRRIDGQTFLRAQEIIDQSDEFRHEAAIVLHSPEWHPGVIGIVASRLVEKYYKPSIMLATVDGVTKGSARSIPGFDIYAALKKCADTITQFGGHKYAAGFTIDPGMISAFSRRFKSVVGDTLPEELRIPRIKVDVELALADITPRFVRILREFAPFGPGNSRPVFMARRIEITGSPRLVGKNHLKFRVRENGRVFDAIGFGLGDLLPLVGSRDARVDALFSVDESDYAAPPGGGNDDMIPQLKIRDLRPSESSNTPPVSTAQFILNDGGR